MTRDELITKLEDWIGELRADAKNAPAPAVLTVKERVMRCMEKAARQGKPMNWPVGYYTELGWIHDDGSSIEIPQRLAIAESMLTRWCDEQFITPYLKPSGYWNNHLGQTMPQATDRLTAMLAVVERALGIGEGE